MSKRLIYYDTETTGVRSETDRIIEIAAYDPVQEREFEMLINPGVPIPKEASAIHGISDEMVAEAANFAEVGSQFIAFCEGDVALVAHNNDNFDRHFLVNECKRHEIELPDFDMVDSLKWARKYRPDLPRHSLQYLRQIYGFEENNAHRALDDVRILYQVFSAMIDDLSAEKVLELLSVQGEADVMPFGKYQGKPLADVPKSYLKWLKNEGAFDKPENASLKTALEKLGSL